MDIDFDKINAALDKVSQQLHDQNGDRDELRGRIMQLEQMLATLDARGGALPGFGAGQSPGALALQQIQDGQHPHFEQVLAGTAKGEARLKLAGTSLRQALTGEGWGTSDDTSYPSNPARGSVSGEVIRPLSLLEALPHRPFERDASEYVRLTAVSGSSETSAEAGEQITQGEKKAELAFEAELARAEIITVAAWTPAARQVLQDHAELARELDRIITGKCRMKLEELMVNGGQGDYSDSKMTGLLEESFLVVPTFGVAQENMGDLIGHAVTAMRANGFMPDLVVLNPWDWFRIATLKTSDFQYIFGNPTNPAQPVVWHSPVVQTSSIAAGTGLVLDTAHVEVLDRMQPSTGVSTSHEDFFVKNKVAILGELRAGLEIRNNRAVYRMDFTEYYTS